MENNIAPTAGTAGQYHSLILIVKVFYLYLPAKMFEIYLPQTQLLLNSLIQIFWCIIIAFHKN